MRSRNTGKAITGRAVAGLHVVTLAWDLVDRADPELAELLGFAIERSELGPAGVVERYWLRGIKRFEHKDEGLPAGAPVPTSEHPIQTFQWGDYTAKPGVTYRYRIVPAVGSPKLMTLLDAKGVTIEVATEREIGRPGPDETSHDIYFNRGVAGSQAYVRKFGRTPPDPHRPGSEQMKWLSRGLYEALTGFVGLAAGEDAADYGLRAMLYEFQYPGVGEAFADAVDAGADVDIRYEAQSYKDENEAMIRATGIKAVCSPQDTRSGIRHNKFIVLLHKGDPVAVWTGSTNISEGGLFGHSNVGHVIWSSDIAARYLTYWRDLAADQVTAAPLRKKNLEAEPTPARDALPPSDRVLALFSPRDPAKDRTPTLDWYGDLVASAETMLCMTFAFNLDEVFIEALNRKPNAIKYAVFDDPLSAETEARVTADRGVIVASGSKLAEGDVENFLGEVLTGFNRNAYIHDKFLLVDPLGDDPIVVTGSANFSRPSQFINDENMLVIRGDTRVADIYFGEFMRIFDHHYSRYVIALLKSRNRLDSEAGYLKPSAADWLPAHFRRGRKDLRRRQYMA